MSWHAAAVKGYKREQVQRPLMPGSSRPSQGLSYRSNEWPGNIRPPSGHIPGQPIGHSGSVTTALAVRRGESSPDLAKSLQTLGNTFELPGPVPGNSSGKASAQTLHDDNCFPSPPVLPIGLDRNVTERGRSNAPVSGARARYRHYAKRTRSARRSSQRGGSGGFSSSPLLTGSSCGRRCYVVPVCSWRLWSEWGKGCGGEAEPPPPSGEEELPLSPLVPPLGKVRKRSGLWAVAGGGTDWLGPQPAGGTKPASAEEGEQVTRRRSGGGVLGGRRCWLLPSPVFRACGQKKTIVLYWLRLYGPRIPAKSHFVCLLLPSRGWLGCPAVSPPITTRVGKPPPPLPSDQVSSHLWSLLPPYAFCNMRIWMRVYSCKIRGKSWVPWGQARALEWCPTWHIYIHTLPARSSSSSRYTEPVQLNFGSTGLFSATHILVGRSTD